MNNQQEKMFSISERIEELLDHEAAEPIIHKLRTINEKDSELHRELIKELKMMVILDKNVRVWKLQVVEYLMCWENTVDQHLMKVSNIFLLVALMKGYLAAGMTKEQIKNSFVRNLKKEFDFWGLSELDKLYNSLVHNLPRPQRTNLTLSLQQYLWQFILANPDLIPPNYPLLPYVFKSILALNPNLPPEAPLFKQLLHFYTSHSYHTQNTLKNFRYILQFFRHSYHEKQCGFNPQLSSLTLLKAYPTWELDHMFSVGSIGLEWGEKQFTSAINNCIKLGLTESTYVLMRGFLGVGKRLKKYQELLRAIEPCLTKPFIFLKYAQLFAPSLKFLKEFMLGPWAMITFYEAFAGKVKEFSVNLSPGNRNPLFHLIECIIHKYKEIILVDDLKQWIKKHGGDEYQPLTQEQYSKIIDEYDWKAFDSGSSSASTNVSKNNYHGLLNVGNSCYINSFVQCLYMNKQLRRNILQLSTLGTEKQLLEKLNKQYEGKENKPKVGTMARQMIRPMAELQRTFTLLLKSQRTSISPANIKNVSPPQFHNLFQHDAIEFGRSFLELIFRSGIPNIFQGQILNEIRCHTCDNDRHNKEVFLDLMLTAGETQQTYTMEELVHETMKPEYIQGLFCDNCNKISQQSSKSHRMEKFPPYMVITLKRFGFDVETGKNSKKKFKVNLKEEVEIEGQKYCIYGMIIHRGTSANSGHYFSFCRDAWVDSNKWVCFNDVEVTIMEDFTKVVEFLDINPEDTPYIFFAYHRQHIEKLGKQLQEPIVLRGPLQSYIQKDDMEYMKSLSKRTLDLGDLSVLKMATGPYVRKDDDDDDMGGGGFSNFHNNPIV